MAFAIDGLISGIDTTTMIDQLMQLESRPQLLLKSKVSSTQSLMSALQQLNTRVSTLGSLAEKSSKPGALNLFKATSSSDKVSVKAGEAAASGAIQFDVKQIAQAQVSVSALMSEWPETANMLTIALRDGQVDESRVEINTSGKSLDEVVAAINSSGAGVSAMKVAAGADAGGKQQYRVQFSATDTGSDGAFKIHQTMQEGTSVDLLSADGAFEFRKAQDAQVVLWKGITDAEEMITSSSNTFKNLVPGVEVIVSAVSTEPVTVTINRDNAGIAKKASDLVDGLASLFSYISTNSSVSTSTSTGTTVAKGGIFTSDSSVRDIEQRIMRAATGPVEGRSPSEIGISITKDGTVEFDAEKFAAALEENPAWAEKVVQEISSRVATAAKAASDPYEGAITLRIQSQQSEVKALNTQVDEWDRRLEMRRSTLSATWSNLEVTLQKLQSQGDWLSSQLATLPAWGSSKK
ncbi:flagellar filament capping protein FliD [Arthrobacter sp. NPDC089319]|uniref:flagellar filament capping protein FliD n=1 Tax=Arthrobacter sp. NPDC089319 TaxID=3155915 RepID=UPI0034323E55